MTSLSERLVAERKKIIGGTSQIAVLDIERLPGIARVEHRGLVTEGRFWDLNSWKHSVGRRIHPDEVIRWPRTICAAWQMYHQKRVNFASEWQHGSDGMHQILWDLAERCDILVGHNIDGFDMKKLRAGWAVMGLYEPSQYKTVDTLKVARANFAFESNTLDALAKFFGVPGKSDKYNADIAEAAVNGNREAQRILTAYNKGDIHTTMDVYDVLRPWINNHPAMLGVGAEHCHRCACKEFLPIAAPYVAQVLTYKALRCANCGAPSRERRSTGRISNMQPIGNVR